MSFILDALKKSESERQRQSGPALFEVKLAPPRSRLPAWAIGLVLLFGANLLVLAWVLTRTAPAPQAAPPVQAAPPPAQSAIPTASVTPVPIAAPAAATPVVAAPMAAAPAAPAAAPGAIPSRTPPLLEEPVLSGEEGAQMAEMPQQPAVAAVAPAPASVRDEAPPAPSNLPLREELAARGVKIPDLRLDMHVYAPQPADRFVFVNMQKLREGEATADGLRVENITPQGAVLSWQGKRFLLTKQ